MTDAVLPSDPSDAIEPLTAIDTETHRQRPMSPGKALSEARRERGLSIEEVAEVLRFSVKQIESIEQDNYQALPGATLVRGFIRGYAKFLRIDSQPLLAQLDTSVPTETSDVRPPSRIATAGKESVTASISPTMILSGLAIAAILLLGIFLFIEADLQQPPPTMPQVVVTTPEPLVQDGPVQSPELATTPTDPTRPDAARVDISGATSDPTGATTSDNHDVGAASVPAVMGLVLDFDDLSWVEVRDAGHNVILAGEYPKGTKRVVEGKPPYSLWVGRASVVRVAYKGQAFDIKAGSREDVARLIVE